MNNEKIGKFLKQLRREKKWTQSNLIDLLEDKFFCVSQKTISDWETGKTIPSLEVLNALSSIYDITITEILEGKYINNTQELLPNDINNLDDNNVFSSYCNTLCDVIEFYNSFLYKLLANNYSLSELLKFNEVIKKFYTICEDDLSIEFKENYINLFKKIKNISNIETLTPEEKYFELNKLFILKTDTIEKYICNKNNLIEKDKVCFIKIYNLLNFYQKDILLMKFYFFHKIYKNFDDLIKLMIENGGMYNKAFSFDKRTKRCQYKVIDELEKIFIKYIRPKKVNANIPGIGFQTYIIENTYKNNFYLNYADFFVENFNCKYNEFYELTKNNLELSDDLIMNSAKMKNINIDRDINLIRSDVISSLETDVSIPHFLYEREIEDKYYEYVDLYNDLIKLLKSGEKYFYIDKIVNEKPNFDDFSEDCQKLINGISLNNLKSFRDLEETHKIYSKYK